ncbi:MAG TPA: PfkB family carbohydrate kinase [Candidatus Binatia bacterium]|nr:PfkB family carbohydrate kinase [Candidatus Binatia bacterium]
MCAPHAGAPVVLVVGAASRDVVADDPRGWRLGGAVMYTSLALARLGFRVRALVGADEEAAASRELAALAAMEGLALAVAPLPAGPVFDNVAHLLHAESDRIPLTALPRAWTSGNDGLLVVPVADEVGDEWAAIAGPEHAPKVATPSTGEPAPRGPAPLVGVGWQGMLRVLRAGELVRPAPPRPSPLLRRADVVVASVDDILPGVSDEALLELLGPTTTLVRTDGANGGDLFEPNGHGGRAAPRRYPAIPTDGIVDPTGAGDVFLASMLAARLSPSLGAPETVAAAAASLAVEGLGLDGVPDLAAVRRRMTRAPRRASR